MTKAMNTKQAFRVHTLSAMLTKITKHIHAIVVLGLLMTIASCTTTKKALNKISEGNYSQSERKQLATICAAEFPPLEFISEGTTAVDDKDFQNHIAGLEQSLQDAQGDVSNLIEVINNKDTDIEKIQLAYTIRIDSLRSVLNHLKKVQPAIIYRTRDTSHLVNKAELERCEITNTQLRKDNATRDVTIEKLQAENKVLAERPDRYWKGIMHGLIAGLVFAFGAGIFLKLKRFI